MKYKNILKRRLFRAIIFLIIGIICGVLYFGKVINNTVLLGLALGCGGLGILAIMDYLRKTRSEDALNKSYVEEHDERNRMLSGQAKCTAFDITAFIGAVISIIFIAVGLVEIGQTIAYTVCAMVVIFIACYMIFKRKY